MRLTRRRSLLLLTTSAVLLASVLVYLYLMSKADESGTYTQARDLIRQIKQNDSQWENEILKARTSINYNYDPLVWPVVEMKRLWRAFESIETRNQHGNSPAWRQAYADYQQAFEEKANYVERFKSHNAVLRNSLAFLPAAADGIQAQLGQLADADALRLHNISTDTYDLMLSSLEFAQMTTDDKAADILVGLNKLAVNKERLPLEFHAPIDTLSNHIALILREQPKVNQLLEQIGALPVAAHLDAIAMMLDRDERTALLVNQRYHFYLLVFSTLLVLLLLYMAVWLLRSFGEINRVNRALVVANDELEQRVARRTQALTQASAALQREIDERKLLESQLVQSEKLASLGQLAAGIAHEVNNPIGFVSSNLGALGTYFARLQDMLKAYRDAEPAIGPATLQASLVKLRSEMELAYILDDIPLLISESKDGISRVGQIVRDLKDFSRVDSSQDWQWANLHQGIDSTLNIAASELKYKADLVKQYGVLPEVECLPSQINQVIMNLVVNAAHAMGTERGTITVRTGCANDDKVWIEVADNGCGIPAQSLQKIFDPFYTTKPVGQGTGLGLSLSYGIIKRHCGEIHVHSEVGVGTTFRVELPVRQAQAAIR
ncbi:Sporulation kinase E [compost metagenome]|jgi:signal transduction histidine kinase|uniref:DAHL domain-containing protein n=1 Tax=Pseudomonas TaxID=286 RepID=UPI0004DA79B9|nr:MULTISPECIES: DAHL domain-containing protein [Pseudomonas]KEY87994.1 histidine kinase [Pseudomonas capeferrum]MCH7301634.1 ATP-binding protein [Pseudomonas capeferrum]MDD2062770.1 ATP-binding protein [Pseudomonas sp. 25571]MDD2129668.1 ATP-binding protein [Pseudomonas sp. 17391]UDU83383.1 ATP-binding protein [Pseudomonas sp. HN2-3]